MTTMDIEITPDLDEPGICMDDYRWDDEPVVHYSYEYVDLSKNINKFYEISLEEEIDIASQQGHWIVVKRYGRIGTAGQEKRISFFNKDFATVHINDVVATRLQHGYQLCYPTGRLQANEY